MQISKYIYTLKINISKNPNNIYFVIVLCFVLSLLAKNPKKLVLFISELFVLLKKSTKKCVWKLVLDLK